MDVWMGGCRCQTVTNDKTRQAVIECGSMYRSILTPIPSKWWVFALSPISGPHLYPLTSSIPVSPREQLGKRDLIKRRRTYRYLMTMPPASGWECLPGIAWITSHVLHVHYLIIFQLLPCILVVLYAPVCMFGVSLHTHMPSWLVEPKQGRWGVRN